MNSHSWNIGNCVHFCLSLDVTLWCPQFYCDFHCDFCHEVTCHLQHCRMYLDVWWAKCRESPFKFPASEHQPLNMQGRRGIILFDWEFIDRWHEGQSIKTRLWCSKFKAMTHDFCHVSSNWAILKMCSMSSYVRIFAYILVQTKNIFCTGKAWLDDFSIVSTHAESRRRCTFVPSPGTLVSLNK